MYSVHTESAGQDVLEAAIGCLQVLSKASVDESVRNQLLGKIFQSFGDIHNNEAFNNQRKMVSTNRSGDKDQAHGENGYSSRISQKFHQNRSTEEVSLSSLFASLSEAVSKGALDIKDFFSVVTFIEESMLQNSKNEHAQNGILTVIQDKIYENEKKHSPVRKGKEEDSPVHASSLVLWNATGNEDGNAAGNEAVHVHGYEQQDQISRNYEPKESVKERERAFCPLDNRIVFPQGTLIQASSSPSAAHAPQYSNAVHTSCMAAGNTKSMSNTLPQACTSYTSLSNGTSNNPDIFEKDFSKNTNHVTPALHPSSYDENYPSSKESLGKSMKQPLSFLEAVKGHVNTPLSVGSLPNQNNEGTNQNSRSPSNSSHIFKIDQSVLNKRKEMCRFSILGKLSLAKGEEPWTWHKLKAKLDAVWNLNSSWRLISIGKGYFQIVLTNKEEYDKVWSKEVILLNPGTFRLQCWKFGFDPSVEKTTKAQVWFRFFQLPWCLWDTSVLLGIASKIGQPLRIDKQTMEGSFGHFARVLIEVDLSKSIMSTVLVDCNEHVLEVQVSPENMPSFCTECTIIGHSVKECRRVLSTATKSASPHSEHVQIPEGSNREHKDIRRDTIVDSSLHKRKAQNSEWRRKKVQGLDNGNDQPGRKDHVIVETVTDFSAQGGSPSTLVKRTDSLIISNQFAVFGKEIEAAEMMVESTPLIHELEKEIVEEDENNAQSTEVDIDITKIPSRWSDLIDEVTSVESQHPHEINSANIEADTNLQIRTKPHEGCIWLNHDDDTKYDRDMCVEIERYKNSAKATRSFIANLPKKDKKVKIAFKHSQGKG